MIQVYEYFISAMFVADRCDSMPSAAFLCALAAFLDMSKKGEVLFWRAQFIFCLIRQ
jgi:hypothetical protein